MMNDTESASSLAAAQRGFTEMYQTGVFNPVQRFVCRDADAEDRVQEGLASAWRWYAKQVALGREPDVALAVHVVRLRTVDRSRRFVCGDRSRWRNDVYEQQGRDIELRRLELQDDRDDEHERYQDPTLGLARLGVPDPAVNIVSAMDLCDWLDSLDEADREMLGMRGAGYGLKDISGATGNSVAKVFRRARELGHELAERAEVEVVVNRGRSRAGGVADVGAGV